jgi:hypothetical protein
MVRRRFRCAGPWKWGGGPVTRLAALLCVFCVLPTDLPAQTSPEGSMFRQPVSRTLESETYAEFRITRGDVTLYSRSLEIDRSGGGLRATLRDGAFSLGPIDDEKAGRITFATLETSDAEGLSDLTFFQTCNELQTGPVIDLVAEKPAFIASSNLLPPGLTAERTTADKIFLKFRRGPSCIDLVEARATTLVHVTPNSATATVLEMSFVSREPLTAGGQAGLLTIDGASAFDANRQRLASLGRLSLELDFDGASVRALDRIHQSAKDETPARFLAALAQGDGAFLLSASEIFLPVGHLLPDRERMEVGLPADFTLIGDLAMDIVSPADRLRLTLSSRFEGLTDLSLELLMTLPRSSVDFMQDTRIESVDVRVVDSGLGSLVETLSGHDVAELVPAVLARLPAAIGKPVGDWLLLALTSQAEVKVDPERPVGIGEIAMMGLTNPPGLAALLNISTSRQEDTDMLNTAD